MTGSESTRQEEGPERTVREKITRWTDPLAMRERVRERSGIEAMKALMSGEIPPPPVIQLMGFRMISVEEGTIQIASSPDESHYNLLGSVHGGVIATLLDTAMGCAVQTLLPVGRTYTTLNLGVNYMRAITLGTGVVTAEGKVIHAGRSTALAQGKVTDASGKLIATAETTCLLFDVPNR